jgi:FAD/FMN-containing dehydrogenase/Fe-S oxidoreductase
MISTQQQAALNATGCEIAFDSLTRQLYATDASLYRIEPAAVAFPRHTGEARALVQAALQSGISIIPRGAGTGLVGGAIGDGLILDFSRHNRQITDLDLERGTVRVGPGVVLDQLNRFLRPFGFCFGPDVATSSRATLGGMIANNSSGARTLAYGTTCDHVNELEVVTAQGELAVIGPNRATLPKQRQLVRELVYFHSISIQECFPPGLSKRWPGYAFDRAAREPDNLVHLLCGSEGTLAVITSAEIKIVPVPAEKGMGLLFFASVAEAMQATVELADLRPAAIEHMDRVLLDQTKGQREFQAARDLMELDHAPCQAVLLVEFFGDVSDRLGALAARNVGLRKKMVRTSAEMELVWQLRKAGLSLLTGRKGAAKPVTGIEDTAVRPEVLPQYVAALESLMGRLGVEASFYGHAAAGLLHVRPVLDLRSREDLKKFRKLANEVSVLVRHFKGSLAGEHGVGIARTEFLPQHLGDGLMEATREIKASFDPHNLLNPGKIVPDGRYEIDDNLRLGPAYELKLPFEPILAFAAKDGSFTANLDQCNGCGGCRKESATMCPTFQVTLDEVMSTRGRANAIRSVLEAARTDGTDTLRSPDLDRALSNCLSCKACTVECPSNVNLSLLKAELHHARIGRYGLGRRQRVFSFIDWCGQLGCLWPNVANAMLESKLVRHWLVKALGLAPERPLPHYARQRFDHWFARRSQPGGASLGRVVLWDDTFVRYHEPHIGMAAVRVLEAAGFQVSLASGRKCCGRPAFSQGHLDRARKLGSHNLRLLNAQVERAPVIFLEPSCYSMFVEDYLELGLPGARHVADRSFLFEDFVEDLLRHNPKILSFNSNPAKLLVHAHCHVKALGEPAVLRHLAARLPKREVSLLGTGCCGMAGAFGHLAEKYELSRTLAEPLLREIRGQPLGTVIVASGASCRHQIEHFASLRPRHMAEVLAGALE